MTKIDIFKLAKSNYKKYPEKRKEELINKFNGLIASVSRLGQKGVDLNFKKEDVFLIDEIEKHYKNEGFTTESHKTSILVIWAD